jgi:uncharacterized protein YjbJ (UPF0337 family)
MPHGIMSDSAGQEESAITCGLINTSKTQSVGQRVDAMTDTAREAIGSVKDTAGDAVDRGQAAVGKASAAASDMAKSASQQVTTFASEIEAMTKRNPLGMLAGAFMAGVFVGLLRRVSA